MRIEEEEKEGKKKKKDIVIALKASSKYIESSSEYEEEEDDFEDAKYITKKFHKFLNKERDANPFAIPFAMCHDPLAGP